MRAFYTREKRARRNPQSGFTLIEVVLALTILSIAMVIVFQSISMGQRSWARGTGKVESATRLRVVLDLMTTQLRSARDYREAAGTGQNAGKEWTAGDGSSIGFVTSVPYGVDKKDGLYYVKYFLSGKEGDGARSLKMLQVPIYAGHPDDYNDDVEKGAMVLLPEVRDAEFEFSGEVEAEDSTGDRGSSSFETRWPPTTDSKKALRLVRFVFGYPGGSRVEDKTAIFVVLSASGVQGGGL